MKTLEKLKALYTYWVVIYALKIFQFLFIIFFIKIINLLNFCCFSFVSIIYDIEEYGIIPESKVLGTSPTSDPHSESDAEKSQKPEFRDSMDE